MSLTINLEKKVVLITGVSSGIGTGIARMFAMAGAAISGCDIHEQDAVFTSEAAKHKAKVLYTRCDVTVEEDLRKLVQNTIEKFGKIDVLVSNAGKNYFVGTAGCSVDDWEKNIQLNLTAHWKLAILCRPYLVQNNGVIIIMGSNHANSTIPGCFPYNIAKTALTGLVKSLAIEWGPAVRTIGIAPGFIETAASADWFASFPDPEKERQDTINRHPVKKVGTPEEIGGWCVFLASEYAAFASGTTYLVDGGRSALMQDN